MLTLGPVPSPAMRPGSFVSPLAPSPLNSVAPGAVATSSGLRLIPLGCAQLFSMYVGEGEDNLREAFRRARLAAPCILFLDEVDALAPRREQGGAGGADAGTRLLSALLTEMDGMELATGVLVLAATNRPQSLDSALLRPGRLELQLYVPPPDRAGRLEALEVHCRRMALGSDVDLQAGGGGRLGCATVMRTGSPLPAQVLADRTELFTGADLAGLCREAALAALREDSGAPGVAQRHFLAALGESRPSLTHEQLASYECFGRERASRAAAAEAS